MAFWTFLCQGGKELCKLPFMKQCCSCRQAPVAVSLLLVSKKRRIWGAGLLIPFHQIRICIPVGGTVYMAASIAHYSANELDCTHKHGWAAFGECMNHVQKVKHSTHSLSCIPKHMCDLILAISICKAISLVSVWIPSKKVYFGLCPYSLTEGFNCVIHRPWLDVKFCLLLVIIWKL